MLDSQSSQSFPHQTSYVPFLKHTIKKIALERSMEGLREFEQQFQNMLDSPFQKKKFKIHSHLSQSNLFKMNNHQSWKWVWDSCMHLSDNLKLWRLTIFPKVSLMYSFSRITDCRKICVRNKYGSLAWAWATIWNHDGLII